MLEQVGPLFHEIEEFYRNLIPQVKDYAIFPADPQGVIIFWDEGSKNALGYPVVDESGACCGIVAQADIAQHAPKQETAEVVREISRAAGSRSASRAG